METSRNLVIDIRNLVVQQRVAEQCRDIQENSFTILQYFSIFRQTTRIKMWRDYFENKNNQKIKKQNLQ